MFSNNTERLQSCANLLDTCSRNIQSCSNPNCNQLTECVNALQPCRKSRTVLCFRFLQFGRSTNVLESVEGSFALFLALIHLFNGTFFVLKTLYQFSVTKSWAVGFILITFVLIGAWVALLVTDVPAQGNSIKILQLALGFIMILLIGVLMPLASLLEKIPKPIINEEGQSPRAIKEVDPQEDTKL